METNTNIATKAELGVHTEDFAERVRVNQAKLTSELRPHYDFIVCGSGSSGSVVARRLAENPDVTVLLLEAGGSDDVPSVRESVQWALNLGSERDWNFVGQSNPNLNGRSIPLNMGKVLGGGSSINVMAWARGHKNDWNFFASETGDTAWNYESVLNIYRRIEDWHGAPDQKYRGTGGLVFVQPAPDPNPIAPAMVEGASSIGIPTFESNNGRMMEADGGACHHRLDQCLHDYIEAAGITDDVDGYLFRTARRKQDAHRIIRRRAKAAGVETRIGNHTFRATGITAYLKNSGKLEVAQQIANHESPRTTKLYDRRQDEISLDEIERITI